MVQAAASPAPELATNHHQLRQVYVGIDVHKQSHVVAVVPTRLFQENASHRVKPLTIHNKRADFEELDKAILDAIPQLTLEGQERRQQAVIAIDHTGGHYSAPLVYFLSQRGYMLLYLEAKALKAARNSILDKEDKTDEIDCHAMAEMLYLRDATGKDFRISARRPDLGNTSSAIRALIRQNMMLNKLITRCTNQLHQLLTSTFPEAEGKHFEILCNRVLPFYPTPAEIVASGLKDIKYLGKKQALIIDQAKETVGVPADSSRAAIQTLAVQRLAALQQAKEIDERIMELVSEHPYRRILMSFPGIGYQVAAAIIAATRDIERWPNVKAFRKGMGVYATIIQSGEHAGEVALGREGSAQVRTALYQAVFSQLSPLMPDNPYRRYYEKKVKRGMKPKKAIIAACGKLVTHIYAALSKGEPYKWKTISPSLT